MVDVFNLEYQYQNYLNLVGLDEEKMNKIQAKETKQAFFAGCGAIIVLMRDEISELEEKEAIEQLESLNNQLMQFWK